MTEKQTALLEKAKASLDGARALLRIKLYGFAASRAYYTMFYVAEALLLDRQLEFSSHAGVISTFGKEFSKSGLISPEYHRFLVDGQDRRLMADYETGVEVSREKAEDVMSHAQQFLDLAQKMLGSAREGN
ncbi:MAG: HEPN domain-containing protein [candidate division WOR-3 bacterium]|nr:HEPN domain-containing protein [candidate division WOR-3 bacterium]